MDVRIGNASLNVEGVRQLKNDVKLDEPLKNQLAKDGFDEVIYQKGDEVFVAYGKNMDLEQLNVNFVDGTEYFNEDSAYDQGQLSVDGDAVKVLHKDDETKTSFWIAPYTGTGNLVKGMLNSPEGKSALIGVAAGAAMGLAKKYVPEVPVQGYKGTYTVMGAPMKGIIAGTAIGATAGGLRGDAELTGDQRGLATLSAGAGYAVGYGAGLGTSALIELAAKNPKATAAALGTTALVVGAGVLIDKLSDSNKPSTLRVINKISQ